MRRFLFKYVLVVLCASACAACATAADRGAAGEKPVQSHGAKGTVVYLAMSGNNWNEREDLDNWPHRGKYSSLESPRRPLIIPRKIEMVQALDANGRATGSYVLPVSAGDLVLEGVRRELAAAGYAPVLVRKLPPRPERGIDVTLVQTELQQRPAAFDLEGNCALRIKVDHWRHGSRQGSRSYRSTVSARSTADQHRLLRQLLEQAAQEVAGAVAADLTGTN